MFTLAEPVFECVNASFHSLGTMAETAPSRTGDSSQTSAIEAGKRTGPPGHGIAARCDGHILLQILLRPRDSFLNQNFQVSDRF